MTLKEIKDKLEIGLKPDAPYRPTNLPESELANRPKKPTDDVPAAIAPDEDEATNPYAPGRVPGTNKD